MLVERQRCAHCLHQPTSRLVHSKSPSHASSARSPKPWMSYQLGIAMPPFNDTGWTGAVGSLSHWKHWFSAAGDAGLLSILSILSHNRWPNPVYPWWFRSNPNESGSIRIVSLCLSKKTGNNPQELFAPIASPSDTKRVSGNPCAKKWAPDSHPSAVSPRPCSKITQDVGLSGPTRKVLKFRARCPHGNSRRSIKLENVWPSWSKLMQVVENVKKYEPFFLRLSWNISWSCSKLFNRTGCLKVCVTRNFHRQLRPGVPRLAATAPPPGGRGPGAGGCAGTRWGPSVRTGEDTVFLVPFFGRLVKMKMEDVKL